MPLVRVDTDWQNSGVLKAARGKLASPGTPSPRRLAGWLLGLAAPYVAAFVVRTSMRVSNAKVRRELGWQRWFATYHEGIQAMVSPAPEGGRS